MSVHRLRWMNRPPDVVNFAIHPGLRHPSRLHTKPKPYMATKSFYPEAQFKIVKNVLKGPGQLLVLLTGIKNLFTKQLPNMGSSYITRLVFDLNAQTVVMLHDGIPTAAICSRFFIDNRFIEIVFCAVDANSQALGYGRLIMNFQKTYIQVYEIYDMLTCADNDAVTYFKKQGFNEKEIRMHPHRWIGCIKDYDFVTLVHCKVYPDIDYLNFPKYLAQQFNALTAKTGIKSLQAPPDFEPPWLSHPLAPVILNDNLVKRQQREKQPIKDPNYNALIQNYDERMATLNEKFTRILEQLRAVHDFEETFGTPVTEEIAPDYFEEVKTPMDFRTVENRLKRYPDYYKSPELFAMDILTIAQNCRHYNSQDQTFVKLAADLTRKFRILFLQEFPERKGVPTAHIPSPPSV